jgi:hypothetical protein
VHVAASGEGNQEAGIGDPFHLVEKPFR